MSPYDSDDVREVPDAPGMNMEMVKQVRLGPNLHSLKEDVVGDVGSVLGFC